MRLIAKFNTIGIIRANHSKQIQYPWVKFISNEMNDTDCYVFQPVSKVIEIVDLISDEEQ